MYEHQLPLLKRNQALYQNGHSSRFSLPNGTTYSFFLFNYTPLLIQVRFRADKSISIFFFEKRLHSMKDDFLKSTQSIQLETI